MEPVLGKKMCEKCLELDPTYVKAWARKGNCFMIMKEHHKAIEAFENGLKVQPDSQECKDGLQ